jgi:tetratricopeptide (TPR) repeat protein
VKKQQLILVSLAFAALVLLFFFGNTIPPKKAETNQAPAQAASASKVEFIDLLTKAKQKISQTQNERLTALENSVIRGDVKEQKIKVYNQLSSFWRDSAHLFEPYAYYTAEASKLENSEKTLTFAAQLFVDNLLTETDPAMQNWLASSAKDLLDKALQMNPDNDSTKIGLGACFILGNIGGNPMEGILPVRQIAEKNPNNLYAQMVLGLGGKKSGQYDKAIERFNIIVQKQPKNIEAVFQLAECYDLKNDKANAIKWYGEAKKMISNEQIQKDIDKRINELK